MKTSKILLAPEGNQTGSGASPSGSGDASSPQLPAFDTTSHETDAAALFTPKPGDATPPAGEPDVGQAPAAGSGDTKAGDKKAPSVFDAVKPKSDAAAPAVKKNPEDEISLGEKAKPETVKHFSELKTITKTLRTENEQLRAERDALKNAAPSAVPTPEMEKLRAEHKAALDRLAIVDLQNHPSYIKQFVEPKRAAVESIKSLLEANEIQGVDIDTLLSKPKAEFAKAVNEIAAKLPPYDQAGFVQEIRGLSALDSKARDALKQAGLSSSEIAKSQNEKARAAFSETLSTLDFVKAGGLGVVEIPGDTPDDERKFFEDYNASAKAIPGEAEKIAFGGMDDKTVARVAVEAATFRHMIKHVIPRMDAEYKQAVALVGELTEELKAIKGSKSRASKAGGDAPPEKSKGLEDMGHEEAAAHLFSGARG